MPDITGGAGTGSVGTPGLTRAVPLSGWFGSARSASIGGLYAAGAVGSITYNANPASTDWLLVDNADRLYPWGDYCGIPGGIPERTTIYAALGVSGQAPTYVQSVTAAQITAAIVSASAVFLATGIGQIVYLFPGTYNIGEVSFGNRSGVTVCGAGPGQTIISTTATNAFSSASYTFYTADRLAITNGTHLLAGSSYIILASTPTAAFSVGNLIMINQDDDKNCWGDQIGQYHRPSYTEPWGSGGDGNMRFVSRITAVTGNRIDFAAPLPITLTFSHNPRAYPMRSGPPASLCGIEELSIDGGYAADMAARFNASDRCWVKDVEVYHFAPAHGSICFIASCQPEIRRCYFHDTYNYPNESDGMAMMLWFQVSGARIEDNITYRTGTSLMMNGASGNAVLNNFFWTSGGSLGAAHPTWIPASINCNHGPHGFMNLFEGNQGARFQNDATHGSTSHQVLFRNQFHGLDGDGKTDNREIIDLCRASYYHTVVGNVIGDASWVPAYYEVPPPTAIGHGAESATIYQFGWGSADSGDSQVLGNIWEFWTQTLPDPNVAATLLRHGNYDYMAGGSTRWDPAISGRDIPDSLFYDSKPAWFGSMVWPPIGPDLATRVNDIPARRRWNVYLSSGVLADLFSAETTATCDLYLDWHTGADDALVTDAIAAGSCRPTSPVNVPDAYPGSTLTMMRIEADAASPASGFVNCGGSIYDIGDTTQGVSFDLSNAAREEFVMAYFPSSPNVASMGFMFRTDLELEWAWWAPCGIFAAGEWALLAPRYVSGVVRLFMHTSQVYSTGYVPLNRNTWYWVTIQYNRTAGYGYLAVYNPSTWAQVGTTISLALGGSPPAASYWAIGGAENQGNQTAAHWLYGPVMIDWTDGTFPLLPTPAA